METASRKRFHEDGIFPLRFLALNVLYCEHLRMYFDNTKKGTSFLFVIEMDIAFFSTLYNLSTARGCSCAYAL